MPVNVTTFFAIRGRVQRVAWEPTGDPSVGEAFAIGAAVAVERKGVPRRARRGPWRARLTQGPHNSASARELIQ
jgi:hypothetical protein